MKSRGARLLQEYADKHPETVVWRTESGWADRAPRPQVVGIEEYHVWVHPSGRRASVFGAVPWHGANDGWVMKAEGWTIRWANGTVGHHKGALKTAEEAQALMDRINAL